MFNEDHYFTFHLNNALHNDEGKELLDHFKNSFPDLHEKISKNLETHKKILDNHFPEGPVSIIGVRN